jgi:hypothetical protein
MSHAPAARSRTGIAGVAACLIVLLITILPL